MKRVVFAIPSYHRAERQPLVKYLNKLGVPREDIVVCVQNDEDRRAYARWNDYCRVEGANGEGISFNRNQCLRVEPNARLVMCDDGIQAVCVKGRNGKCETIRDEGRLYEMLDRMFDYCEPRNVSVFSLNNSSMGLCATADDFIDHPCVSIFMGICDRRVPFDPRVRFLEDIDRNLRVLKQGGHTYRFGYAFPVVQHGAEGGQSLLHKDPRVDAYFKRYLAAQHPTRVSVTERGGKVRLNVNRKSYRKRAGVLFGKI